MEERIEKADGLTVETLQQQVAGLQDQVRSLKEEVLSLNEDLKKASKEADTARGWWLESEKKRCDAVNMINSLKTVMAAVDIEPFK